MSTPSIITPRIPKKKKNTKENGASFRNTSSSSSSPCPSPIPRNNSPDHKPQTRRMKYLKDLNDYEPTGQIIQGSFGTIYIVIEKSTKKKFVAKTCKCEPKLEHLFLREISLLIRVQNQLIVQFIGFAFNDFDGNTNNITIIMEYIENGSLADLIQKQMNNKSPLDYDNTKRQKILVGISRALHILHKLSIIHRDIKPENILIDDDYNIKITDFGQSKNYEQLNDSITNFGTSAYLAPESIEENSFSQKTDVYAFGILMYEVLSGTRAYRKIVKAKKWNAHKLQMEILKNELRPEINFPINSGLKSLMEACWSKDPKKRPTFLEIFNKLSMSVNEHIINLEDDNYEKVLDDSEDIEEGELPFMKYCLNDVNHKELFLYVEELLDMDNNNNNNNSNSNSNNEIEELKNKIDELSNKVAELNKNPRKIEKPVSQKVAIQNPEEQKNLREKCDELKKLLIDGSIFDVKLPDKLLFIPAKQFMNCTKMASIEIPPSVVTIRNDAFNGCSNLKKVVLPPSVKNIEFNAFKNCLNLESIEIQSDIESIGIGAFFGCSKLKSFDISPSIKIIEEATFYGCASIENLTLPPSIKSINCRAFYGCSKLKNIQIPADVKEIKEGTFYGCSSLIKLGLPQSLTEIGDNAFTGCGSLTKLGLPQSLTKIGDNAFNGCGSLTKLDLPQSLTKIGDNAFTGCALLKKVDIPTTVEFIGKEVFYNCTSLESIVIPESVKEIGIQLFYNCSSLKKVDIKSPLNQISPFFFYKCNKLVNVNLPSTYESIGESAFYECSSLIKFKFPSTLKIIGKNAFINCTSLKNIEFQESLETIEDNAFKQCKSLNNFNFPKTLKNIGSFAFSECESLTKVEIKSKARLRQSVFENCTNLREISLNIESKIDNYHEFYNCDPNLLLKITTDKNIPEVKQFPYIENLKRIEISPSIQKIDSNSIIYLTQLEEITYDPYSTIIDFNSKEPYQESRIQHFILKTNHEILDGNFPKDIFRLENAYVTKLTIDSELKSIKRGAFAGLFSLRELTISPKVKLIETGAFDKPYLSKITIDPYSTLIQPGAFPKSNSIEINIQSENVDENIMHNLLSISDHLAISGNLKVIQPHAFSSSTLQRIVFLSNVTHIGDYAFIGCSSLHYIGIPDSLQHIGKYAFQGCSNLTTFSNTSLKKQGAQGTIVFLNLKSIGEYAFEGCTKIQKIYIGQKTKVEKENDIYVRTDKYYDYL